MLANMEPILSAVRALKSPGTPILALMPLSGSLPGPCTVTSLISGNFGLLSFGQLLDLPHAGLDLAQGLPRDAQGRGHDGEGVPAITAAAPSHDGQRHFEDLDKLHELGP